MTELPEEAVQAATRKVAELFTAETLYAMVGQDRELDPAEFARAALEAAAPAIAAQARAQSLQDAAAGRVTLEEWGTVHGVTVPQRIEDLQTKESFTPEEVEAFFAVADEPSCCDQVRRETAEQIAAALLAVDPVEWALAGQRAGHDAARIARQIGEAP